MSRRRRIIVSLLALVGVPAVVLVLAIVAIAVFGVSIDVSRWREAIAARPAVQRGLKILADKVRTAPMDDKAKEILFGATQYKKH